MRLRVLVLFVFLSAVSMLTIVSRPAFAQTYRVEITNQGGSDFFITPTWFGFHNGSFDIFDVGSAASTSLENLAEGGDVSGLQADFTAAASGGQQGLLLNAAGFTGAPIIDPGETAQTTLQINSSTNRFFSFASMVIPSNDSFIGTPDAIEVFDANGDFIVGNSFEFNILGSGIWDSGTEVNDTLGAAFSTIGGMSTDENGVVHLLGPGGLDNFIGTGTPAGTIVDGIAPGGVFATVRITAVPEPSLASVLGLGSLLGTCLVRRKRSI
ncbi:MAG: spondin domain-containing protein [Pirellulaceae bacterium]